MNGERLRFAIYSLFSAHIVIALGRIARLLSHSLTL